MKNDKKFKLEMETSMEIFEKSDGIPRQKH